MFVGEFLCCVPLLWKYRHTPAKTTALGPDASLFTRILARVPLGTGPSAPQSYTHVAGYESDDQDDESAVVQLDDTLSGWRVCWMWFPAFFDSASVGASGLTVTAVCGTTLMNVGLILTPVSIFQMSRGALVLWVGVLSVIFLRRQLWLYQWTSLVIVTLGVCLVGLSGSLVKKSSDEDPEAGILRSLVALAIRSDDDPAKVALGVILILFAQVFTATQYVGSPGLTAADPRSSRRRSCRGTRRSLL
jgi:hypothetical protein